MKPAILGILGVALLAETCAAGAIYGHLETEHLPAYLRDRGEGVSLSIFGTYVQKSQLIVYPFFEYYHDSDFEYSPSELGGTDDRDFRGSYRASEGLLFVAYGISDRLAFELEAAIIQARLETGSGDGLPDEIEESGLGDVEGQLRWRWATETSGRPEVFSYFETVVPTQDEGSLIGTTDWEYKLGAGVIRGFSWGTATFRASVAYDAAESTLEVGEFAGEYLKRLSPGWRVFGSVEGTQDEVELITEAQWHFSPNGFLKLNSGFGLTSKATDWAPEVGVLFSL
jgi:hypothetical protein